MQLRSGCNFWGQVDPPGRRYEALGEDVRCDVAVIGGGITGALVAYHLVRAGVDTVLLEGGRVGLASTSASTGLLQYELDVGLVELAKLLGAERADRAYRVSVEALEAFAPLVAELGGECGLVPRESLYLATRPRDVEAMRDECAARRRIGIDVAFLDEGALRERFGIRRAGALLSARAFEVDPYRLTCRLIDGAVAGGLRVYEETRAEVYEPRGDGVVLCTPGQSPRRVVAKKVVFATGYATPDFLRRDFCRLRSTYALVTRPLVEPGVWKERCLIWESGRPYFYLRGTEDGRIMCGGEDEDFFDAARRDALIELKTRALLGKVGELLPGVDAERGCEWAGTFAETADGLPYIGTVPEFPHGYFALGYGGNGITFSLVAARIIRDAFTGRPNADAGLFGFER